MVNPILIIVIALGAGFLLSVFDKMGRKVSLLIFYTSLAALLGISLRNFFMLLNGAAPLDIATAGFPVPLSINLRFGLEEAFLTSMVNIVGILSGIYLFKKFRQLPVFGMTLFLMMVMGINGLILTRDIFNLFVFLEITSISTYSLIALEKNVSSLSAGFKYIIATGIASSLYLIGTIYLYRVTGTLNLDVMIASSAPISGKAGFFAVFLVISAILIEYKSFPANGWGLDVYQAVDSGITAMIAVASSGAFFFILYKLMPLLSENFVRIIGGVGLTTFLASNLMALKQENAKRMLGYSSIGQMGLILAALVLVSSTGNKNLFWIVGGLFVSHFFAKAGLFWIAGIVGKEDRKSFSILRSNPLLLLLFGIFIVSLTGLPPFPGFWAKYRLVMNLGSQENWIWIGLILLGSLLEIAYLFRWFGEVLKDRNEDTLKSGFTLTLPPFAAFLGISAVSAVMALHASTSSMYFMLPVAAALILFALDWLPANVKGILTIGGIGLYTWYLLPGLSGINLLFAVVFLIGGIVELISTIRKGPARAGFFPFLAMMILSLGNLLVAKTLLDFFLSWEFMTLSSYFLIIRGQKAEKPALLYMLFSVAGAFMILSGMAAGTAITGFETIKGLSGGFGSAGITYILLSTGFLVKSGAVGLHLWLPGSYADSEDDFSAVISSILSKAGIFGLILFAVIFTPQLKDQPVFPAVLGWIGVLTAFFAGFIAIFQEDIKKLLAYSSMSQVGYIIFAFAMFTHIGWVSSIYLVFNHLLFKGVLFLTIAGVIARTKTRTMYEMGGLIKTMPLSFVAVLMAIIALSGVPPLSGFGSKWLLYTAGIEKGWYIQTGLAFFTSAIAFLYCYRLIHTIFLGQPKDKFRDLKEASPAFLVPSYIMLGVIMAISVFPHLIIGPISRAVGSVLPSTISWDGETIFSSLGYWNGYSVMMVTMGVFIALTAWLIIVIGKVQRVKQFNIVYAAERPDRPETTHVAYNFFASYQKAMGFIIKPVVTTFWYAVSEYFTTTAGALRNIYTGNGQTYALYIVIFVLALYVITGGN